MGLSSFLNRIGGRVRREAADLRMLHSGFLAHHAARLGHRPVCKVQLKGVGVVTLRPHNSDLATFRQIFEGLEYEVPVPAAEAAIRERYDQIIAQGGTPVIVDAGANVGAASLWLRSKFPQASMVSIEPDPESAELLRQNLSGHATAQVLHAAVGAHPGFVELVTHNDAWATQTARSESGIEVITINEAFARVPDGSPLLVKIDIEGFESELFTGNLEWLDRVTALFLEPHDWRFPGQRTSGPFQKALGERDFHMFLMGDNLAYVRI